MPEWWEKHDTLTIEQLDRLRFDLDDASYRKAVEGRIPDCLDQPGSGPIHRLAHESTDADRIYGAKNESDRHWASNDPMKSVKGFVDRNALVPAAFALGALAGAAVIHVRRTKTLWAVGRASNLQRFCACWADVRLEVLAAARLLPPPDEDFAYDFREHLAKLPESYARTLLCFDKDHDLPLHRRESTRLGAARAQRVGLLDLQHEVAGEWPELRVWREEIPEGAPEVILRHQTQDLALGGAVWDKAHYKIGLHWQPYGGCPWANT